MELVYAKCFSIEGVGEVPTEDLFWGLNLSGGGGEIIGLNML